VFVVYPVSHVFNRLIPKDLKTGVLIVVNVHDTRLLGMTVLPECVHKVREQNGDSANDSRRHGHGRYHTREATNPVGKGDRDAGSYEDVDKLRVGYTGGIDLLRMLKNSTRTPLIAVRRPEGATP
jgi:hypothetical protein